MTMPKLKSLITMSLLCFSAMPPTVASAKVYTDEDIERLFDSAERGYPRAQYALGRMYYDGKWIEQDKDASAYWCSMAAEQGYAKAQYTLGRMYYNGDCVEQDWEEAAKWLWGAAEQGIAHAQCCLGWMYSHGEGVPEDLDVAVMWYQKAAEQGDEIAMHNLDLIYRNATEESSVSDPIGGVESGD